MEVRWRVQAADDLVAIRDFIARDSPVYTRHVAVRIYPETPLSEKHLVVTYREIHETDGFVITAYLTNRPSGGRETVWRR